MITALKSQLYSRHIPALDGVRAASILLVILYHFGFKQVNGSLGVEIFFVLSGFLITWLMLTELDRKGDVSLKGFYMRRAFRLFPELYAYIAVGFAALVIRKSAEVPWGDIISTFTYTSNYYQAFATRPDNYLSQTWSLAVEEQFYMLWPVLFISFQSKLKRLTWITAGIILAVWVHRWLLRFVFNADQGYIYLAFDTRADHILIGCLAALLIKQEVFPRFWAAICAHPALPVLTAGLLGLSSMYHGRGFYRFGVGYCVEPILAVFLIIQLVYFSRQWGWLTDNPVAAYLGKISYSLYLYQGLVLYTARTMTQHLPLAVSLAFSLGVTVAFASGSYHFIGRPALKLKERYK